MAEDKEESVRERIREGDEIVFSVRTVFHYKGARLETLSRQQLIDLIRKLLRSEIFK